MLAVLLVGCAAPALEPASTTTTSSPATTTASAAPSTQAAPVRTSVPRPTATPTSRPDTPEEERARHEADAPVLWNLGVDFGTMIGSDTGDFYDAQEAASRNYFNAFRPIDPFGSTFGTAPRSEAVSSSINFWIRPGATLRAPISGFVTRVEWQTDSDDFEIHFARATDDWWTVSFDHVLPLDGDRARFAALRGTNVTAGQPIARPSLQSTIGRGIGRIGESIHGFVELQVNFGRRFGEPSAYFSEVRCPALLLDRSVRATLDARMREVERRWEEAKGDPEIYEESAFMDSPGCVARVIRIP